MEDIHIPFLQEAINQAKKSKSEGGIPIGSVLVRDGKIVGKGHNKRVQEDNPILHGEMDCLLNAGRQNTYTDCTLYSTLMPCYMCAGTIVQFKIPRVVVGENTSFPGAQAFLEINGVTVINANHKECISMMEHFIDNNHALWNEDIQE